MNELQYNKKITKSKIKIAQTVSIFYHIKMLILTFEEVNNKFGIDNKPAKNIRIKDIIRDISLIPIEIVMRDQKPETNLDPRSGFANTEFNIIIHPTDGTNWVLVIRRQGGPVYYVDSFGVETPPLFLEEYVYLGSTERIKHNDESFVGRIIYT